jgi:hypothetical protein
MTHLLTGGPSLYHDQSALYWQSSEKCFQHVWSSLWGPGFFTLVFFGAVAAAAVFLLVGPEKAATVAAAFIIDSIPGRSMSLSPDFLSALLLAEQDGFWRFTSEYLPTTVFFLAFILLDSSEGGVALVAAPFMLLTPALALAEDFRGQGVF